MWTLLLLAATVRSFAHLPLGPSDRDKMAFRGAGRGVWEVTLYNLLPSTLASHLITHNGNICRPLAQTATCRCHDEETKISQKTVDRWVRQQLARDTTREKEPMQTLRDRKHTRRYANRKTHLTQGVTVESRDTYKRSVNMWMVCAQQDGSMSSLFQLVDSRAYVLVHIVGPLAATLLTWF